MKHGLVAVLAIFSLQAVSAFAQEAYLQEAQMRLPPGSYDYTCRNCDFDGRELTCDCRTSSGFYYRTSIDWGGQCGGGPLANHEGALVCGER